MMNCTDYELFYEFKNSYCKLLIFRVNEHLQIHVLGNYYR